MEHAEIPFQTVAAVGDALRAGEVSAVDVTEAYLARISALNGEIRAYLTITDDLARQQAQEAASEIATGNYRGPLHGVPVAVKDQMYTAGIRTTGGSPVFGQFVPEYDATVITRLKEAGAVFAGQTQHDRVRHHRAVAPVRPATQPVGQGAFQRRLQQRERRGHGCLHVRRVAGRRHRRLGTLPRRLVRTGRAAPHVGAGSADMA